MHSHLAVTTVLSLFSDRQGCFSADWLCVLRSKWTVTLLKDCWSLRCSFCSLFFWCKIDPFPTVFYFYINVPTYNKCSCTAWKQETQRLQQEQVKVPFRPSTTIATYKLEIRLKYDFCALLGSRTCSNHGQFCRRYYSIRYHSPAVNVNDSICISRP